MKKLARLLAYFSLTISTFIYFDLKLVAPRLGFILKLLANVLSPLAVISGSLGALLGWLRRENDIVLAGSMGASLAYMYIRGASTPHDGFERAFGADWQQQISPIQQSRMLRDRWQWSLTISQHARFRQDVPFWTLEDTGRELLCDLWLPPWDIETSGMAIVYVHGGGWHYGDKDMGTREVFRHLAAQGHLIMDVSFRMAPETNLNGMVADVRRAIAYLKQNAQTYQINPERIVVMGASSGAHLALLAAYAPSLPAWAADDITDDTSVYGVVSIYGGADMAATYKYSRATFGESRLPEQPIDRSVDRMMTLFGSGLAGSTSPHDQPITPAAMIRALLGGAPYEQTEDYTQASPMTYIAGNLPPTLILHGSDDSIVPVETMRNFYRDLQKAGVTTVYVEFPQTEHGFDLWATHLSPTAQAALHDIERFLVLLNNGAHLDDRQVPAKE